MSIYRGAFSHWLRRQTDVKLSSPVRLLLEKAFCTIMQENSDRHEAQRKLEPRSFETVPVESLDREFQHCYADWSKYRQKAGALENYLRKTYPQVSLYTRVDGLLELKRDEATVKQERAAWVEGFTALEKEATARLTKLSEFVNELEGVKLKAVRVQLSDELQKRLEAL